MSSTLDDLFQQILQSEQRAQQRKNFLNEVKAGIESCRQKIRENEDDVETLKGQLVLKTQQLNNEELNLKWLTTRQNTLQSQQQALTTESENLNRQLNELKDRLMSEYEMFSGRAKEFYKGYALDESGWLLREEEAKQQLVTATQERDRLQLELQTYNRQKEIIATIEAKNLRIKCDLEAVLAEESRITTDLEQEQLKSEQILEEKLRVSEIPQTDQEFLKLQKELDAVKDVNYERRCQSLQQELQQLQQTLWQKELRCEKTLPRPGVWSQPATPVSKGNILKVTNFSSVGKGNGNESNCLGERRSAESLETITGLEVQTELQMSNGEFNDLFCEDFLP